MQEKVLHFLKIRKKLSRHENNQVNRISLGRGNFCFYRLRECRLVKALLTDTAFDGYSLVI